jgi:pimeloyl-ACP methyl ester carboxylesterase
MNDVIVLLHGSATGSYSWRRVQSALTSLGLDVFAADMLGYGKAPAPSDTYSIQEEVAHLQRAVDLQGVGTMHLVAHSLGSMMGLHLRRALGARVTRMTLIDFDHSRGSAHDSTDPRGGSGGCGSAHDHGMNPLRGGWEAFTAARLALGPNRSLGHPADRYRPSERSGA